MVSALKASYEEQGYVIVPGLIAEADSELLKDACERVINKTREGSWKHRRTVGKQFPPFGDDNPDSWGVQHLMHPELGEPAFVRWYTSSALLSAVQDLLECNENDLQMELFNLLINPLGHKFALRWHRDDVKEDASEEEERKALGEWHYGVQWNTALYRDSCLYVVPKSQKVPRTPEQREHSETQIPPENPLDMPNAIQVVLQSGETVFYNSNILHCATYDPNEKRATLHGCIGNIKGGSTRARNVLQHGLEWMENEEFYSTMPDDRSKAMLENLHKMQSKAPVVEYSLEG